MLELKRFYSGCAECDGEVSPRPVGELATTTDSMARRKHGRPKASGGKPQNRNAILSDRIREID